MSIKQQKNLLIVTGCLCALAVCSIGIIVFADKNKQDISNSITIEVDDVEYQKLSFNSLNLKPGEQQEYYVNFVSHLTTSFNIDLNFECTKDGGLAKYVDVFVEHNDFSITESLDKLFTNENAVSFNCSLTSDKTEKILIEYSIPNSVGNEAQKKSVDFDLFVGFKKSNG